MNSRGAVLEGLDEFMLRLGHLRLISTVAVSGGGRIPRIERNVARVLVRDTQVPGDHLQALANYLAKKSLAPHELREDKGKEWKYPNLLLFEDTQGLSVRSRNPGPVLVSQQDAWLCQPAVASPLGAVSVRAKAGSKNPLSHLIDWARALGLISPSGQPSSHARILAAVTDYERDNPFVIRPPEAILFAHLLFSADGDFLDVLIPILLETSEPIAKKEAVSIYLSCVARLREKASIAYVSGKARVVISRVAKEAADSAKEASKTGRASTAWHRISSRMESLTDLGVLSKKQGRLEGFEYVYFKGSKLQAMASAADDDLSAWLFSHGDHVFGTPPKDGRLLTEEQLRQAVSLVGRGLAPAGIDALALALAVLDQRNGVGAYAVSHYVAQLIELARTRPDVARLSRGGSGTGAEFISLDLRKLNA